VVSLSVAARSPGADARSGRGRSLAAATAVGVGIVAFGLCLWRVMPGLSFWDTAEFQMVLPVMGTAHPTGYPTYVLIGWLASILLQPLGEAAFRMNVLSAILVGVGAAFATDLGRRLTGSRLLGLVVGIGTAVTPIVWAIGTHADPHALHFAFLSIILWLLVRWEAARRGARADVGEANADADANGDPNGGDDGNLVAPAGPKIRAADDVDVDVDARATQGHHGTDLAAARRRRADRLLIAAAVVVGLAVGNHSLTLLLGPPIALFVLAVEPRIFRRPRLVAAAVAAFAIPTVLVRFEMVLRAGWFRAPFVYADPSTWSGFWYVTLGEQFHSWFTNPLAGWPERIQALSALASEQLGPLAILVVLAFGVTAVVRPRYALLTGTTMVLTLFFNSVYPDGAIDRYYIGPVLIAWTWLAILAGRAVELVSTMFESSSRDATEPAAASEPGDPTDAAGRPAGATNPAARAALTVVAAAFLLAPTALALPDRATDPSIDMTTNVGGQRWTNEVLDILQPNAVVVSWWSYSTPLWYATIVDGRRPDITIIDDRTRLDQNLGELDQVIARFLPTRPVYLVRNGSSELPAVEARYDIRPAGRSYASNLLEVFPRGTGAGS
jgi:hypothetical protein